MITVTFVRHGESTDNLKSVWAGWLDSPLSVHGMNVSLTSAIRVLQQARALGAHFSQIRFAVIHASDLKRAFSTAEALCAAQPTPAPPLAASALFREQSFGLAEGTSISWTRSWDDLTSDMPSSGRKVHFRSEKFPNGESLDELAKRAEQAIQEIILPYAWEAARTGFHGAHVVVVSHGLFLSEIMAALLKKDALGRGQHMTFRGHKNTAWSRVTIDVKGAKPGIRLESPENEPILVHLTHFNQWDHLLTVKRQGGGIGRAAHDSKQKDIRSFFAGGILDGSDKASESDADKKVSISQP